MMNNDKRVATPGPTPARHDDTKTAWTRPRVQKMVAGDAENAFTQAVDDGPFTRS